MFYENGGQDPRTRVHFSSIASHVRTPMGGVGDKRSRYFSYESARMKLETFAQTNSRRGDELLHHLDGAAPRTHNGDDKRSASKNCLFQFASRPFESSRTFNRK